MAPAVNNIAAATATFPYTAAVSSLVYYISTPVCYNLASPVTVGTTGTALLAADAWGNSFNIGGTGTP
jgi:hypothetical protein